MTPDELRRLQEEQKRREREELIKLKQQEDHQRALREQQNKIQKGGPTDSRPTEDD